MLLTNTPLDSFRFTVVLFHISFHNIYKLNTSTSLRYKVNLRKLKAPIATTITTSIGIAMTSPESIQNSMMKRAYIALYKAKRWRQHVQS